MIADFAGIVVQAFGAMIGILCLWGLVAPTALIRFVQSVVENPSGLVGAVVVRIVLGAALITAAQVSAFPMTFTVLGWIAICAAIGLLIMGQRGMRRVVGWVDRLTPLWIRIWLAAGLVFAAFLILGT